MDGNRAKAGIGRQSSPRCEGGCVSAPTLFSLLSPTKRVGSSPFLPSLSPSGDRIGISYGILRSYLVVREGRKAQGSDGNRLPTAGKQIRGICLYYPFAAFTTVLHRGHGQVLSRYSAGKGVEIRWILAPRRWLPGTPKMQAKPTEDR